VASAAAAGIPAALTAGDGSKENTAMNRNLFPLLVPALLVGAGTAARAQTGAETKPVTLNVSQVSVQAALKALFASAGVKNFVIDRDIPAETSVGTLSLNGVPFSAALSQVLSSTNPALVSELRDGVYHVRTRPSTPPESEARLAQLTQAQDAGQTAFYKIGIKHYDAGVIADAITRRGGIILLPPNFVIPANSVAPGALAPPTTTQLGPPRPQGLAVPAAGPPGLAAANVLPPGVKRIFVLESDNSLVIEATPQGYDDLTGERLLSGGYTQVY